MKAVDLALVSVLVLCYFYTLWGVASSPDPPPQPHCSERQAGP